MSPNINVIILVEMKLTKMMNRFSVVDDRYTDLVDARTYNIVYGVTSGIVGIIIVLTIVSLKVLSIWSWEVGFIDPSTAFAEALIRLYNFVWSFLFLVLTVVFLLIPAKLVILPVIPITSIYFFLGWLRRALSQSQTEIKPKNLLNNRLNLRRNYTPYGKFNYKHEDVIKFLNSQFKDNFKNKYESLQFTKDEYELRFKNEYKEFKKFLQADSIHEKFYDAELIEITENEKIVVLKAYSLSKDTNSIYFFGEENRKIELLNIFNNTGTKDSIGEIGIKLEIKLEDLEKVVNPSDLEKLRKWGINKEEMESALKETTVIINNIESKKVYNLNKGGKVENIESDFKGDNIITTEELFDHIRKNDF